MIKEKYGFKVILLLCFYMTMCSFLYAQPGFDWVKHIGGTHPDDPTGIATDAAGNVYVAGTFRDTIDIDPGTSTLKFVGLTTLPAGGSVSDQLSGFITKFDVAGNLVWAKLIAGKDVGYSVTMGEVHIDASGNIYVQTWVGDDVFFDPKGVSIPLAGGSIMFSGSLLKISAAGDFIWSKAIPNAKMGLDQSGYIYCAGRFRTNDALDFDPGTGVTNLTGNGNPSKYDVFISKYDTAGNFIWAGNIGGEDDDGVSSLAVDPWGNVYTTGLFAKTADFDPGRGTQYMVAGSNNQFILKLDSSGNFAWVQVGLIGLVHVDGMGNVYTTGSFNGTQDFDPGPGVAQLTTGIGKLSQFLRRSDTAGNFVWVKQTGGAIKTDGSNNIYLLSGIYSGVADFDPDSITGYNLVAANGMVCISKLDSSGKFIWAQNFGGNTYLVVGAGIAVALSGNVYTTGYFYGTEVRDFDPGVGVSSIGGSRGIDGINDIFIHKMSCPIVTSITDIKACSSYDFFGQQLITSGEYTHTIVNGAGGCDSIISLTLTIAVIDVSFNENAGVLTAGANGATYQWIDCANGNAAIGSETGKSFTPFRDGRYAVAVTQNGCSDTSDCYEFKVTNIHELSAGNTVHLYPNPTRRELTLQTERPLQNASLILTNVMGQRLMERKGLTGNIFILDIAGYVPGVYFAEIEEQERRVRVKLIKE